MPFDPSYPPTGAEIQSAPLRDQFTGLKELIDAILTIVAAQIDSVSTLDPSQAATVSVSVNGQTLHFSFGIPRGADGTPAPPPEVTLPMLDAAIASSSANTNAVGTLDTPFADPDAEALRQKLNELLLAARR